MAIANFDFILIHAGFGLLFYAFSISGWKFAFSSIVSIHTYAGCHDDDLTFLNFLPCFFLLFQDYDAMHVPYDDEL